MESNTTESLYRKLFEEYIIKELDLQKYDKIIENSELKFLAINKENMDIYQYLSSSKLKYFYIRNNIHIERLGKEQEEFLQKRLEANDYELDEKAEELIKNTYKEVIIEGKKEKDIINKVFYGPMVLKYSAPNDAIVIGMRFDQFNKDGLSDEEWDKQNEKREDYLLIMLKEMREELKKKLTIPIEVIEYDMFSVSNIMKGKVYEEN